MSKIILIVVTMVMIFSGCSEKVREVQVKVPTIVKPPKSLFRDIETPTPMNKETYIKANPIKRERILVIYSINLLATIKKYKIQKEKQLEWYDRVADKNITKKQ